MKMIDKASKLDRLATNLVGSGVSSSGGASSGIVTLAGGSSAPGGTHVGMTGGGGAMHHHNGKPVPMKLFAAWEVDRTPSNCIPRLCSLTITRLSILIPLPGDMTSLSLAVKMQSSKRTLRSHEIPITSGGMTTNTAYGINMLVQQQQQQLHQQQGNSPVSGGGGVGGSGGSPAITVGTAAGQYNNWLGSVGSASIGTAAGQIYETDLDLHFSLQYPHFIKRDGNRLVILLQRRKKYKSRTILGYKTLAEGIIRMDAVLQKSMDMTVELTASGKNGHPGATVACLRAERVSSIPVDHDNKNNNVLLTDRVAEYSDEDEEGEFSSGEFNDDANELGIPGYDKKRDYASTKHDMRKYHKLQRSEVEDVALGTQPVDSDSEFEMTKDKRSSRAKISRTISLQQRNFKQKIVALLKRFKASEELGGEVNRGTATLRDERDLDALFQELESLSCCEGDDSGPDMDSLSIGSTPKPSLRPFFTNSRIMLHDADAVTGNSERRSSDKSDQLTNSSFNENNKLTNCIHLTNNNNSATTPDRTPEYRYDSSGNEANAGNIDAQVSDPQNSPPRAAGDDYVMQLQLQQRQQTAQMTPVSSAYGVITSPAVATTVTAHATPAPTSEKRSRLFRTSSSTTGSKQQKKQMLSLSAEPRSVLEACLSPTNVEPRKLLLDQLSRVFTSEESSSIPDVVTLISPPEALSGNSVITKLTNLFMNSFYPAFVPQNTAEVKAVLQALMGKIQKYCNSNAKPPTTVKILLIGGDWLQGAALRHYVDLMGVRPPDWLNHLRFYIVPIGGNSSSTMARHLSNVDQAYGTIFGTDNWTQLCERAAQTAAAMSALTAVNPTVISSSLGDSAAVNKSDIVELVNRIQRYLHAAGPCTQIPVAEAMVNYKDEDSCQIFVPFVSDVRIGYLEGPQASLDLEESAAAAQQQAAQQTAGHTISPAIPIGNSSSVTALGSNIGAGVLSSSPPQQSCGRFSPPLQATAGTACIATIVQRERISNELYGGTPSSACTAVESVELQVDYWPLMRPIEHTPKEKSVSKSGDQGKNSIKSTFRSLQVWRLPQNAQIGEISNGLTLSFATKEKKQKQIMRLGKKKEKDRDLEREQCVEGVARLICSPKQSHPVPLRVYIDGTEWTGVKFFQLSSQWQTHVKNFPVALIGCTPMSCSELS